MNQVATFDPHPFLRALDGDHATFLEFGRQFLAMLPGSLASLYEAAAAGDATALREHAHALKGSVAIFHAHPLLEELEAIERACRLSPAQISAQATQSLDRASDAFRREFDHYCAAIARGEAVSSN
jgi:HPt (histidine-containing phosphotransfer) domain-containing protein